MTIEGKAEISASVNCTEGTKRGHGKNQSQGTNNTKHEKTWALSILVKISGISGSAVNGTRFVGSSQWKIPRKSGKTKKVVPFSRLEFPNGMSCSIYVCTSSRSTVGHRHVPGFTTKWNNFLPIGNSTFPTTEISGFFFPKWKAPLVTNVVEPDILVVIPTVQQEVISVIDVGWKDIFKSSARQSRKVKQGKSKQKATGTPREVLQIWLVPTTKKSNHYMHLR